MPVDVNTLINSVANQGIEASDPARAKKASEDKKWEDQLRKARAQGILDRAFWIRKLREDKAAEKRKLKSEHGLEAAMIIHYTWLKKWASQSKIVSTVITTLNKLLGLLVDVILMPFLPIIMGALIFLADAIIGFQEWWSDKFPETEEGKRAIEAGKMLAPKEEITGIDVPTLAANLAGGIIGAVVGYLLGGPWGAAIGAAIGGILSTVLINWAYSAGALVGGIVYGWGKSFGAWLMPWVMDTQTAINTFITGAAKTFTDWMWELSGNLTTLYNSVSSIFQQIIDVIIEKLSFGLIKAKGVPSPSLETITPRTTTEGGGVLPQPYRSGTTTNTTYNTNTGGESMWDYISRMWMETSR